MFEKTVAAYVVSVIYCHIEQGNFEVRHPRSVLNKSNCKVYTYIDKHNCVLGGMLFAIRKARLHVLATNFGPHQVVQ